MAEQEILQLLRHLLFIVVQLPRMLLLHHSYTMLSMCSSQCWHRNSEK